MNTQQYYAIQENNKKRLIKAYGEIPNTSGIYFLFREEDGIKFKSDSGDHSASLSVPAG